MKQTIEIEVPEGKKAVWKNNKVVFEDIKQELPKTWEEYCVTNHVCHNEFYIGANSGIIPFEKSVRNDDFERNLLASEEDAKAHLALMQLHRLRDCYRQGWVPNIKDTSYKYFISRVDEELDIFKTIMSAPFLSFQSEEVAKEFLNNFRDLIEQAGDLI